MRNVDHLPEIPTTEPPNPTADYLAVLLSTIAHATAILDEATDALDDLDDDATYDRLAEARDVLTADVPGVPFHAAELTRLTDLATDLRTP